MPNRFNNIYDNQYVSTYVPLPFEEMVALGALKQGKQDTAVADREEFLGKTWNRLKGDEPIAQETKKQIDTVLQDFSGKDFNDPQVKADWYKTKVALANEFGPAGAIGMQEANYKAYIEEDKRLKAMVGKGTKEGGITKTQYDYLTKKALDDYNAQGGIGTRGPEGYQSIKFESPAPYQDLNAQALAIGNGFKADAIKKGYWTDTTGKQWAVKNSSDWEGVDKNEVKKAVKLGLMSDPANQAFVNQQVEAETYGKQDTTGFDKNGNPVEYRPGMEDVARESVKNKLMYDIYDAPAEMVAIKEGYSKTGVDQDIRENTIYTHAANKKTDEYVQPFTVGIQVATTASKYDAPSKINEAKAGIETANTQELVSAQKFIKDNGIGTGAAKLLELAAKGNKNITINDFAGALGSDGISHRDAIGKYLMAIQQNNKNKADIEDYDKKIKIEAGLGENWKPSTSAIAAGDAAYEREYKQLTDPRLNATGAAEAPEKARELALKARDQKIKDMDPTYQKYLKALEENAANQTATIGVTNFTDKNTANAIASIMTRDLNENGGLGAKWLKSGDELGDEYGTIGKINADQLGWTFDPESGELMIVSRPEEAGTDTKDGKKIDYIKSKAPEGVLLHLINNNDVTTGELAANQLLTSVDNSANRVKTMNYEGIPVTIEAIFPTDKPKNPDNTQYKISDGNQEFIYTGRQNAITALKTAFK